MGGSLGRRLGLEQLGDATLDEGQDAEKAVPSTTIRRELPPGSIFAGAFRVNRAARSRGLGHHRLAQVGALGQVRQIPDRDPLEPQSPHGLGHDAGITAEGEAVTTPQRYAGPDLDHSAVGTDHSHEPQLRHPQVGLGDEAAHRRRGLRHADDMVTRISNVTAARTTGRTVADW